MLSIASSAPVVARVITDEPSVGLGLFTAAGLGGFVTENAGEILHQISVSLTGLGMLLTGIAVLRTGRWRGWQRFTSLACGLVPFLVELPGFITFGDTPNLHIFIAGTSTSWPVFFTALWTAGQTPAAEQPAR